MRVMTRNVSLSQTAFDALLSRLDPDRDRAGARYELLRRKLVTFFEFQRVPSPDEASDVTLDRVCRRLAGGEQIQNVTAFILGVARLVAREALREQRRQYLAQADPLMHNESSSAESERRARCFNRCLAALPSDQRRLIIEYCRGDWHARTLNRKRMALRLGIPPTALRLRIHRIRAELERCLRKCCEEPAK
jgi:DNA-directed RNA polymerase specialized sigma24 family protein